MSITDPHEETMEILDEEFIYTVETETTCTICQAEFLDPEDLHIHLIQIHKLYDPLWRLCMFCCNKYTDILSFAEHFRDNHLRSLHFCSHCLRAFTDLGKFHRHEKCHKIYGKASFKCAQCTKRFGNTFELRKHDLKTHSTNGHGVMIQPFLPFLSSVLNVKAETVLMTLHMDTVYICVCCNYSTANINLYIEHNKKQKCESHVCDKCSNVYKKKYTLQRHLQKDCQDVSTISKSRTCPDCHCTIKKYLYRNHKKFCKVIKCFKCGLHFDTMYNLSEHQSSEHPLSVELQTCTFCWKQCVGTVALQKHMDRSHKQSLHLYKYKCIRCNTPYKHPKNLFGHYFTAHKDLEPYTCKICDKKFRLRKQFTLHIKLEHKSVGFVEFDENYHVFFTEKKSEKPFVPKSLYEDEIGKQKSDAALVKSDDSNISALNMNSEMSITETEGNQTEMESTKKPTLKCKRVSKKADDETIILESSDDEPLLVVKKKIQKAMPKVKGNTWNKKHNKPTAKISKKQLTCNICKKYCYTYQNYNHHITLHSNKDYKKCIKCSKVFRSKEKLNNHIASEHKTSKLTETLKYMLEKRKTGGSIADDLPMSEKFRRTIKKVPSYEIQSSAKIKEVDNGLSVQKFIENFTPEAENRPDIIINHVVTMKMVSGMPREPAIKMTKFQDKQASTGTRLAMPVKFKPGNYDKTPASIRLVHRVTLFDEQHHDNDFYNNDDSMDRHDSIPEVAEEVMLENTEETPRPIPIHHKIIIPKLPKEYKDIRIAHLLPQAPYYKIVKVKDVLNMAENANNEQKPDKVVSAPPTSIKLPDGTKLVTTNPLAHLLGETSIEKVMIPIKNKYYKPKGRDFQGMLVEALSNLHKPLVRKRQKKSKDESSFSDTTSQADSIATSDFTETGSLDVTLIEKLED